MKKIIVMMLSILIILVACLSGCDSEWENRCPECDGEGTLHYRYPDGGGWDMTCPTCDGKGWIDK